MTSPLVRLFWKYRSLVFPGLLALVFSDACQLVIPFIIKHVVDALTAHQATAVLLLQATGLLALLVIVTVIARFTWRHFFFTAARKAEVHLREQLLDQVLHLPAAYHSKNATGQVMALATNDVPSVRMALAMGMVAGFDATIFAGVAIGAMLALDWRLTCFSILPFPVLALVMAISLRLIYLRWDRVQSAFEDLTEKTRESLSGMRVLRAYVQAEGDARDFDRFNQAYYERQMEFVKVDSIYQPAVVVLAGLSSAILLGVGGTRVVLGQTSLGSFAAFASYLGMLAWPMVALGWMLTLLQRGAASLARIDAMLAVAREPQQGVLNGQVALGGLEVRDLTFSYPETSAEAVTGVSFSIRPGGSVGLVGEVGSGKSTLALLLSRIYDPPPDTIFLDGQDVTTMNLGWLRRQIAWVPQEAFLFSETIEENLRLGEPDASDERLQETCRLAAVHEEIMEFPLGYQTMLGERGVTLSGGQKQRICLARALLKRAPVLVLDDTLSAVDSETERSIIERLRGRLGGCTSILISHRISAVRDLDHIIVLRNGRIVQEGNHAVLMSQPGFYRELYELQEMVA